jgi:MerR family transcriptional regulator, copper efflux regulator
MSSSSSLAKLMRVGELAKAVGKTVRAMHLYEELGLLEPDARSEGGFRMYGEAAIERIKWIVKLQAIGFTLAEIQGFIADFQGAVTGKDATTRVRSVFADKLQATRDQLTQLRAIENDLLEAIEYLDSCETCAPTYTPNSCGVCDHHGHHPEHAPKLFAGLSRSPGPDPDFDVAVEDLTRDHGN